MWMTILSFVGGPIVSGLIKAYQAKLAAGNTSEKIAADVASTEIAAQVSETNAIMQYRIAEIGHWYEPDKIMGYLVALLLGKIIIWDVCLGWGVTLLHEGWMSSTANTIVMFYFGKRGFENVARIIKR